MRIISFNNRIGFENACVQFSWNDEEKHEIHKNYNFMREIKTKVNCRFRKPKQDFKPI